MPGEFSSSSHRMSAGQGGEVVAAPMARGQAESTPLTSMFVRDTGMLCTASEAIWISIDVGIAG
jgi:hypothetical protein